MLFATDIVRVQMREKSKEREKNGEDFVRAGEHHHAHVFGQIHLTRIGERLLEGKASLTPPSSAQAARTSSLAELQEPTLFLREGILSLL